MQCRNCGTEIADKAIVCFRCGVGTTDPVRKPVPIKPVGRRMPLVAAVVPLLLALAALALGESSGYPREMDIAAVILASAGILVLIARLLRRR
ncbi:MAG: hypothetical protein M3P13_10200 [Acidobacteriota bacterium]|jgi:hypothetical protein|nr:hypothetical protein [Acidobacteriota bacterium]